jgi:hypothetical protein
LLISHPAEAQTAPPPPPSQSLGQGQQPQQASPPAQQANRTQVTLCNNTGARIYIALVYYQPATQRWTLSAWHARNPGECKSQGGFQQGLIYYFAEKEGGASYWPARNSVERSYCVPRNAVERTIIAGQSCAQNERLLGFRAFNANTATYRFNFNG